MWLQLHFTVNTAVAKLCLCDTVSLCVHEGLTGFMSSIRTQNDSTFCKYIMHGNLVLFSFLWDVQSL